MAEQTFSLIVTAPDWQRARVEETLRQHTPSWTEDDRAEALEHLFGEVREGMTDAHGRVKYHAVMLKPARCAHRTR